MTRSAQLRTAVLLSAVMCASATVASAQTGPVLTLDAIGRGLFDTNVLRNSDPAEGYGGGGDLLLRAANRLRSPTLQLEYAASLRQSTLEDPNDGVGHRVNLLAGIPFADWLRLHMIARGSRGGADEDQVSAGDELMLSSRLDIQPLSETRLRGYGAYRMRRMSAGEPSSNGQDAGVELRQRIGPWTTLLADARYEEFHGPDSTRDWYRRSIELGIGQSLFRNTAIEAEVRLREREHPERFVEVEQDGDEIMLPRLDTDRRYGVALVYDNGSGTEIRLELEREQRLSNDVDKVWQADRATFVVRQRIFALGGDRRDPPRIDVRPGTDAIHRAAGRNPAGTAFMDVLVAGTATCAISHDGALCWPAPSASVTVGTPEWVPGRWQRVEAASGRACGLDAAGTVFCWTWPTVLSGGAPAVVTQYHRVRSELSFVDLAVGASHACALTGEGEAYCWGGNDDGQLGNDLTRPAPSPARVVGGLRFKAISAGARHTCALDMKGVAHCWGDNGSGQAAAGRLRRAFRPTAIHSLTFASITAGTRHSCGLTKDGRAYCWGDGTRGQTGVPDAGIAAQPLPVAGDIRFRSIAAGWAHTCALSDTGRAFCWGANAYGQLGTGSTGTDPNPVPVPVAGDRTFRAISASFRTCALDAEGQVFCWGGTGRDAAADLGAALPTRLAGNR